MSEPLERNARFSEALSLMASPAPFVFITGRAGTGKSTLLRTFRGESSLVCPVLAPTGVAALNVGGETIHRFFHFSPHITIKDARRLGMKREQDPLLLRVDAFIIDEISMVRADLIDCIDVFLRAALKKSEPFGGKRVISIGDLAQLPPVVLSTEKAVFAQAYDTPYFFSARAMQEIFAQQAFSYLELNTIYRQTDPVFVGLLNAIRDGEASDETLMRLNARHLPITRKLERAQDIILTTTNARADTINASHLMCLKIKERVYEATVIGDFPPKDAPTDTLLRLKQGARVMCTINDPLEHYVNGSLGTIHECTDHAVVVDLDSGRRVIVSPHTWHIYRSRFDEKTHGLTQEKIGSFLQIPLRLAWAVTIHKSQGKTFEKIIIDLEDGAFAHGQVYVALSRSRSLEGITLTRPIQKRHLFQDASVRDFSRQVMSGEPFISRREKNLALL